MNTNSGRTNLSNFIMAIVSHVQCRVRLLSAISVIVISYGLAVYFGLLPQQVRLENERCIDDLGCYSLSGDYQLRTFNVLPQYPHQIGTVFILVTADKERHEFPDHSITALIQKLDTNKKLIIAVHGWRSYRDEPGIRMWMKALVDTQAPVSNIILVEWVDGAHEQYHQSVANTRVVGSQIAQLLNHPQMSIKSEDVHIMGISLGAHIAGYAGALVSDLGRITGLDAAGPLFEGYPASIRLDSSDAQFVDVIHTDGDEFWKVVLAEGGLGIHHPIGHADFYPNGGHSQPFCINNLINTLSDVHKTGFGDTEFKKIVACDHELSLDYLIMSLYGTQYEAFACNLGHNGMLSGDCSSTNRMGFQATKPSEPTSYYLHTTNTQPFLGYHYKINITQIVQHQRLNYSYPTPLKLMGSNGEATSLLSGDVRQANRSTAMMFGLQPLHTLKSLIFNNIVTQLSVNVEISHNNTIYYGCGNLSTDVNSIPVTDFPC